MNEWKTYRLYEIIELIGGGTPRISNPEYWNGTIPWLSVADFNTGRKYVSLTEKTISEKGLNESSTKLLKAGDIIISARGTVGVVAVLDKPMAFNQSCYGVRANLSLSINDYIYYLLKDTIPGFLQIAHGGVFDTITRDTFNEIETSLPPLHEQRTIASILSSLDDKIDLLHRQNATLEKMAETLFRQWFVEEAKEEWEEGKLSDLVFVKYGKDHKKILDGKIPVFGSGGLMRYVEKSLYDKESVLIPRKVLPGTKNTVKMGMVVQQNREQEYSKNGNKNTVISINIINQGLHCIINKKTGLRWTQKQNHLSLCITRFTRFVTLRVFPFKG